MPTPFIKTTNTRNQYLLTNSHNWVRNHNLTVAPIDINKFIKQNEQKLLADNEMHCLSMLIPEIGSEKLTRRSKILIVSDGYQFDDKKHILYDLPRDVCIIGVNRALAKWDIDENGVTKRKMDFYFVNNPFPDCMKFMPRHSYRPKCVCSLRTNASFLKKYKGQIFYYIPTPTIDFGRKHLVGKPLDDYRNPICGALSLAIRCGVQKLAFFCCDNVFANERATAEKLSNGLWMYPQHRITHEILDGMLYWLKNREDDETKIEVVNHSAGPEYECANYIDLEAIKEFFT